MSSIYRTLLITSLIAALPSCGSDRTTATPGTGTLSLGLTDAPVDSLQSVIITLTGISLKPADGEIETITFLTPKVIDLLDLQNGTEETLLDNHAVTAGTYSWVRLELSTEENELYVVDDLGGTLGLTIPSGSQTGLKLNTGFIVPEGGDANFTIDFDLRKSVTKPTGQENYFLKPSLRLIDHAMSGTLEGEVSVTVIQNSCANNGEFVGLVYVFSGANANPNDYSESGTGVAITAAKVGLDSVTGNYAYRLPSLSSGNYTLAYSCDLDDTLLEETLNFQAIQNFTISTNSTTSIMIN